MKKHIMNYLVKYSPKSVPRNSCIFLITLLVSLMLVATASATIYKSDNFDNRADWNGCTQGPSGWATYFWNNNYCNRVEIGGAWDDAHGSTGKSIRITWPSSILELGMATYNVSGASHVWTGFWWKHDPGYTMGADNQDKWIYFNEVAGVRNMISHKNNSLCFFDGSNYNLCVQNGTTADTHPNTDSSAWVNDSSWHYYTILADPANDDIRIWRDGTELKWNGDNLNAGWSGKSFDSGHMLWGYQSRSAWGGHVSYFDDIVAASTKGEVVDFLKASETASPTTPQAAPVGSNSPPLANAGSDQTITDLDGNGSELVKLDGYASSDPDGSIVSHSWREGSLLLSNAAAASVSLGVGVHDITLTVTDNGGAQASDNLRVTVVAASATPSPATGSSNILLQESFSDTALAARDWYDAGANTPRIVSDAVRGKVLEFSYANGAAIPTTGTLRHLFSEAGEITLSYQVKYQSGWSWITGDSGPHELYLLTNLDHAWKGPAESHGTTYIEMHQGKQRLGFQDALNIDQSNIGVNLKNSTEYRGVFGCNGSSDAYPDGICWGSSGAKINGKLLDVDMLPLENNRWYQVKYHFKMNSIVDGKGVADGVIEYWLDGELLLSLHDVLIRTGANPNLQWNQVMIAPYFHNGTPQAQKFWIDDLLVNSSTGNGPTAPTELRIVYVR